MIKQPSKKPKPVDRSLQLFVGGLPAGSSNALLFNYFSKFGKIRDASIVVDSHSQKSKGFAFITFFDKATQMGVLKKKDHFLLGIKLVVKMAFTKESTDEGINMDEKERKVFVVGLAFKTKAEDMIKHFSKYGWVQNVELKSHKGFAFVLFKDKAALTKLFADKKPHVVIGKTVECRPVLARNEIKQIKHKKDGRDPQRQNKNAGREKNNRNNRGDFHQNSKHSKNPYSEPRMNMQPHRDRASMTNLSETVNQFDYQNYQEPGYPIKNPEYPDYGNYSEAEYKSTQVARSIYPPNNLISQNDIQRHGHFEGEYRHSEYYGRFQPQFEAPKVTSYSHFPQPSNYTRSFFQEDSGPSSQVTELQPPPTLQVKEEPLMAGQSFDKEKSSHFKPTLLAFASEEEPEAQTENTIENQKSPGLNSLADRLKKQQEMTVKILSDGSSELPSRRGTLDLLEPCCQLKQPHNSGCQASEVSKDRRATVSTSPTSELPEQPARLTVGGTNHLCQSTLGLLPTFGQEIQRSANCQGSTPLEVPSRQRSACNGLEAYGEVSSILDAMPMPRPSYQESSLLPGWSAPAPAQETDNSPLLGASGAGPANAFDSFEEDV